jgi:tetratricopeptide (TPR) repeat protein
MSRRLVVAVAVAVGVALATTAGYRAWRSERLAALRQTCLAARDAADWPRMERLAETWTHRAPGEPEPWLCAAQAALELGRPAEAAAFLGRLPEGHPKTVLGLLERVDLLVGPLADPLAAIETCQRIIAMAPATAEAHRRLLFLRAVLLDRLTLAADARRAIALRGDLPDTYVYLVAASWITLSNTATMNARWLAAHPEDETFLVAQARGDISNRGLDTSTDEPAEASDADPRMAEPEQHHRMRTLLERFPHNTELLAYFLERATLAGSFDEAVRLLAAAGPEAEHDGRFWRFKGQVHAARDELPEAEAAYREAIGRDPFDFASRHLLATLLRRRGHGEEAAVLARVADEGRALRRTILQQPNAAATPPSVLREIAAFAASCGQRDVARAIQARIGGGG